jgi:hypothetical protein
LLAIERETAVAGVKLPDVTSVRRNLEDVGGVHVAGALSTLAAIQSRHFV